MREITINDIKNYMQGNGRRALDRAGLMPEHIKEQVAYRMLKCPDCVSAGKCNHCGCSVPGRLYTTSSCNHGERFPDLMGENDWINFKQTNNIGNE